MEPTQIRFTPGQPFTFIATKKFSLGSTGVDVLEGMELQFDGTNVEVNGARYTLPQLRGSLKLGWLVLADDYDPDALPQARVSANIQVRSPINNTQSLTAPPVRAPIVTTESDERVVMTRGDRTNASNQTTTAVRQNQHAQRQASGGVARSFGGSGNVEVGGAEFGTPVARAFLTSTKARTEVTRDSVGQAIMAADKVKVQPGQGLSEEDMLARMTEEEQEVYLARKLSAKADVASRMNPNYNGPAITKVMQRDQHQTVGRVRTARTQTSDGITATVSTGGGTEIFDPSGSGKAPEQTSTEVEGMRFTNTNGPKRGYQPVQSPALNEEPQISKIEKDGTADARRSIAKSMCADFPDQYNFSDHWKRRLAMIRLNFEGRADVIRAVFTAESDDFKKVLVEEFPEVFSQ